MALQTLAFDAAEAKGWSMKDLARRSGIPESTLYKIKQGERFVGTKTVEGIMRAFPDLPYERLFFVSSDSAVAHNTRTIAHAAGESA